MATEKVTHLTTAKSPLAGKARKIRYLSASHLFKVPSAAECTSKFSEETLDNRESQAALASHKEQLRREEVWEPVPPAPRVPDPQARSRVRGGSAGDSRATHTHTHAHTRTHARARKSRALWAQGSRGGQPGEGTSAHRSGCRWTSGSFHRGTAAYALLSSEKAQESSWRDAHAGSAGSPPTSATPAIGRWPARGAGVPSPWYVPEPRNSFAGLGLRRGRPSRGAPQARPRLSGLRATLWDFREGGPTAGGSAGAAAARRTSPRVAPPSGPATRGSGCLGVPAAGGWGRGARRGNPAEGNARRKDCTREAAERQKRLGGLGGGGRGSKRVWHGESFRARAVRK